MDPLAILSKALLVLVLWTTGLGLGMGYTVREVLAPLHRVRMVALAVIVNVAIVPVLVWAATRLLDVDSAYTTGILLAAFSMAAPSSLKMVQMARGNVPFAIALVVLLSVLNVVTIPFWASLLLPGNVTVDPGAILRTLLFNVLLPLAIGMFVCGRWPVHARQWVPEMNRASGYSLASMVVLSVVTNYDTLLHLLGSRALLATLLSLAVSLAIGFAVGGRDPGLRRASAIVTSQRAVGPALLISAQSFPGDGRVAAGVVALGAMSMIVTPVMALEWGKRVKLPDDAGDHPDASASPVEAYAPAPHRRPSSAARGLAPGDAVVVRRNPAPGAQSPPDGLGG
jgi:BASS family bile acid:Na+ symporter